MWFVVGLPVFFRTEHGWSFWMAGGFLAVWTIGYGIVQAFAPRLLRRRGSGRHGIDPTGRTATELAFLLAAFPAAIALALAVNVDAILAVVVGLLAFGVVFALNSAVHTYLILAYAEGDKVAMNVGFYYMANAFGRLAGHRPLRRPVPVERARGVPVGVGDLRARGRAAVAAAAGRAGPAGRARPRAAARARARARPVRKGRGFGQLGAIVIER